MIVYLKITGNEINVLPESIKPLNLFIDNYSSSNLNLSIVIRNSPLPSNDASITSLYSSIVPNINFYLFISIVKAIFSINPFYFILSKKVGKILVVYDKPMIGSSTFLS